MVVSLAVGDQALPYDAGVLQQQGYIATQFFSSSLTGRKSPSINVET